MKKQTVVSLLVGAFLALAVNSTWAAYWTGAAGDNSFWNAANWSGVAPNPSGTTTESLFMTNAVGVTGTDIDLTLADGVSFTVVNSTLEFIATSSPTNSKTIQGLSGGTANSVVFDNSTVTVQALAAGINAQLLNGSVLILKGPGRPLNTTLELVSVTMGVGTSITFTNGCTDPDGALAIPTPPRRPIGQCIFSAASLQSYTADALSSPLMDFSVAGTDLIPFSSPYGGGDGTGSRNDGPFTITALPTVLVVNSLESWDGVNNPRAAGGVTKSGTGTDWDPWTYTMPKGMKITSTGKINCWTPDPGGNQGQPIKFVIEGGDLQMDAGAILNIERYKVRTGRFGFTLDLSVTNSITGAGQIGPITDRDSCPRYLTIQNVKNVSLARIDVHTENVNTGASDSRDMSITASGAVVVSGIIDNSDQDGGGDGGWGVTVKANTIDVNSIDTRGMRNDSAGRPPYSGDVVLQALSPVGGYSTGDGVNNASTNKLTVRGSIRTYGVDSRTINGNVTLQSVVLQLVYGVIQIPPFGTQTLDVGVVRDTAIATDLFVDVSSSGQIVNNVVQWGGPWTPPAGSAPAFTADPVIGASATALAAYSGTLAGTATDVDLDPLTYGKYSGPVWLQVAANGALSGTPGLTDSCTNSWQIWVTDGARFGVATLQIFVAAPPRWNDGDANFAYANAVQSTPYADTLATNVLYCGAQTLTFAKTAGPAWLNVAADGALSGTPDPTNVMNNVFTVTVSDGGTPVPATLNIFVNGSPKFTGATISKATAFVSQGDYAVRSQTLAGSAVDPQDPANPATLTWAKVSGPAWLAVDPSGALSGTPSAGDIGVNAWTISAANAYPAKTATLRIIVTASPGAAPVEVVTREIWDGLANPHAADGVTLTGDGSVTNPATYTVPRGLLLYSDGQIYTSQATAAGSEDSGSALHIQFKIEGNLNMDANNNAFVTGVHSRNSSGQRKLILDLCGTNSIVGAGRIVGLGNRVDALIFPNCFDNDTPRILTITNVNNVSFFDINVQVRNANNWGRPLLIKANGTVEVTNGIDNSDRDTGGDGGNDVEVFGGVIKANGVDTRSFRTANFRNVGKIRLNALTPPYTTGGNNSISNTLTVTATLRPTTPQTNTTWGTINLESVILNLGTNAILDSPASGKTTVNVGKLQGGVSAGYLYSNVSTNVFTSAMVPNYVVNWFVPSLAISTGPGTGQATLTWTGAGYNLQTNSSLANPAGWGTVPGATSPAAVNLQPGGLFYRLKSQ